LDADSHSITLSWENTNKKNEKCIASYAIAWNITDGSINGSNTTTETFYVIESLEACVTFEISVSALYVNGIVSEPAVTKGTTLPEGKWHVMCRFMASFIHSY
jgi:hypothetical protein